MPLYQDFFNRTSTGIGDPSRYTPLYEVGVSVNGSELIVDANVTNNEGAEYTWIGAPTEVYGVYQWDFWIPSDWSDLGVFYVVNGHWASNRQVRMSIFPDNIIWEYWVNNALIEFIPLPGWWTVKAEYTHDTTRSKIWQRDSEEPPVWMATDSNGNIGASAVREIIIFSEPTEESKFDNLMVWEIGEIPDPEPEPEPEPGLVDFDNILKKRVTISTEGRRNKQQILKDFIRPDPISGLAPTTSTIFDPGTNGGVGCGGLGQTPTDDGLTTFQVLVRSMDGTYYHPDGVNVNYYLDVYFDGVKALPSNYEVDGNRIYPNSELSEDVEVTASFVRA